MLTKLVDLVPHLIEWTQNEKLKNAEIFHQLIDQLKTDAVYSRIIYMFDCDQNWCNSFPIQDKELERQVDLTLHFMTYIVYLHNKKLMDDEVFGCVEYVIVRALRNRSTVGYLKFINDFANQNKAQCPFKLLIDYGTEKGVLEFF